jgi:hypothetical protein
MKAIDLNAIPCLNMEVAIAGNEIQDSTAFGVVCSIGLGRVHTKDD